MLLIVGLIGCLMLFVKGLEFLASNAFRTEEGWLKLSATIATALCFIGTIGFGIWLVIQSNHHRARQPKSTEFSSDFAPDKF